MLPAKTIVAFAVFLITGCTGGDEDSETQEPRPSIIAGDESIVLFRTAGWFDDDADTWHLPIHGWVYEPQNSTVRNAVVAEALEQRFGLKTNSQSDAIFASRVNWLFADSERGKVVYVRLGDQDFEMPATGVDGHFEGLIDLSSDDAGQLSPDGVINYSVITSEPAPRRFTGTVSLVPPNGVSVISDIDDTIKISNVTDHRRLLDYTFLREFEAASGMAERYAAWAADGAAVHYVSSSPWQLYPALDEFAAAAGFPRDSYSLKRVRFRDETLLDLFKEGTETKPVQVAAILDRWPQRAFILVGDSGEQDPEVYADLLRRYPQQIRGAYIRNVTGAEAEDERFDRVFEGIDPDRWQLFTDANNLELP